MCVCACVGGGDVTNNIQTFQLEGTTEVSAITVEKETRWNDWYILNGTKSVSSGHAPEI